MTTLARVFQAAVLAGIGLSGAGCLNSGSSFLNAPPPPPPAAAPGAPAADPAQSDPAPAPAAAQVGLTIYSAADPATFDPKDVLRQVQSSGGGMSPGFGVVREVRKLNLAAGVSRVEYPNVAAMIDPTTVSFQSLTAPGSTAVLEQNFEFDLSDPNKLLQKYVGRRVTLRLKRGPGGNSDVITGRLLSAAPGSAYVVSTADPQTPIVIQGFENVDSIRLADIETGLVTRPTLNWKVSSQQAGDHEVEVSYQTDGLTWRADYAVVLSPDEKSGALSAWVTAVNTSGIAYRDAMLKLIAGNVHRYSRWGREQDGLFSSSSTGMTESGFFDYHLYALSRPTTLPNDSMKQIELFDARHNVPVEKSYVFVGAEGTWSLTGDPNLEPNFGLGKSARVDVYVKLHNGQAQNLGLPLPAGRVRVYKLDPGDSKPEFVGEDVIQHTAKDEDALVRLGSAFDIVGERTQSDFKVGARSAVESFQIKLRNHKNSAVHVIVKETLYRWVNWEITQSSDKWEKQDYRTIYIPVDVPPNEEKVVTYTVKYAW